MANKQMKIMNTFIRPMLAAALVAAAACSPIEEQPITYETPLSINVTAGADTRSLITESRLPHGAEIGVAIFNPDGTKYMNKNYNHIRYYATNGGDGQIWETDANVLLGDSEGVLYAYYPYNPDIDPNVKNIIVRADDNNQQDFLYSDPCTGLSAKNRHANITMKHALAAVRVSTKKGTYVGDGMVSSLGVGGACGGNRGYINITKGTFSNVVTESMIYPTTAFQLSSEPNVQDILLIPTGQAGKLDIEMTIDGKVYKLTIPDVMLEAGKITHVEISVDVAILKLASVKVAEWTIYDRGNFSAPADYRISLEGDQEGISIGTVIGTDGSTTITAVPYISKEAKVNAVSFDGNATCSQQLNEKTGVRTILIQDMKSNVTVTFSGVTQ